MNTRKNFIVLSSDDLAAVAGGLANPAPTPEQLQDGWNALKKDAAAGWAGVKREWTNALDPMHPMGFASSNPLLQ